MTTAMKPASARVDEANARAGGGVPAQRGSPVHMHFVRVSTVLLADINETVASQISASPRFARRARIITYDSGIVTYPKRCFVWLHRRTDMLDKPDPSDLDLHNRFLGGEKAAGSRLIQRHYNEILGFFQRRLPNEADDLAQAVFEVYVKAPQRVQSDNLRAYFYGVARYKLLGAFRYRGRHLQEVLDQSLLEATGPGVSTIIRGRAEVQKLLTALQSLRIKYHDVVELVLKGFVMREIAEILGENVNTCKTWKRQAIHELRGQFGELRLTPRAALIALHELELFDREGLRELFSDDQEREQALAELGFTVEP